MKLIDLLKISRPWLRVGEFAFLASVGASLWGGLSWSNTPLLFFSLLLLIVFGFDQLELGGNSAAYHGERIPLFDSRRFVGLLLLIGAVAFAFASWLHVHDKYRILSYSSETQTATVRRLLGTGVLELRCYGSIDKGTNVKDPKYSTLPGKEGTWTGVIGTEHWNGGCRPLPIGFAVTLRSEKYPANYLEYDTQQEPPGTTRFSYSYWEIVAER